jgi:hypothetical protein
MQTNGMPGSEPHYKRLAAVSDAIYEDAGLADPSDPGRVKEMPSEGSATA